MLRNNPGGASGRAGQQSPQGRRPSQVRPTVTVVANLEGEGIVRDPGARSSDPRVSSSMAPRHAGLPTGPAAEAFADFVESELPFACDNAEARWAGGFSIAIGSDAWCRRLKLFCREVLLGRDMPGTGDTVMRPRAVRHRERKARHRKAAFVGGHEYGARLPEVRSDRRWPALPPSWNSKIEVPFGLTVGNPLPTRIWGLKMIEAPFDDGLKYTNPKGWALWCAAHSLFAQDALALVLHGLKHGQLFFLPKTLIEGMREIGLEQLTGSPGAGALADKALSAISRIYWDLVDPSASTRPRVNEHGAPIFDSGDIVPWEGDRAAVVDALWLPQQVRYAVRQRRLTGDLTGFCSDEGHGVAPMSFFDPQGRGGIPVERLRPGGPGRWQEHASRVADRARNPGKYRSFDHGNRCSDPFRPDHTRRNAALTGGVVKRRVRRRRNREGAQSRKEARRAVADPEPHTGAEPRTEARGLSSSAAGQVRAGVGTAAPRNNARGADIVWRPGDAWIPGVSVLPSTTEERSATPRAWREGDPWIPGVSVMAPAVVKQLPALAKAASPSTSSSAGAVPAVPAGGGAPAPGVDRADGGAPIAGASDAQVVAGAVAQPIVAVPEVGGTAAELDISGGAPCPVPRAQLLAERLRQLHLSPRFSSEVLSERGVRACEHVLARARRAGFASGAIQRP